MVDFIKVSVSYPDKTKLQQILHGGAFLYLEQETDIYTGELIKDVYKYHNMALQPFVGGFTLKGSIHKLHNEINRNTRPEWKYKHNGFNGNRFTLLEIENIIKHLCKLLDIQAGECVLQNIEIGINNVVPFSAFDFLQGVQAHRNNFTPTIKHGRNYFEFRYSQYYLKLYNKGKQYELYNEVIRVEVKIRKMQKLHNSGVPIHTLADINAVNLEKAFNLLVSEFEQIVNIDATIRTNELTNKEKNKLNELSNLQTWHNFSHKQRQRAKETINNINVTYSDNQKGQIIEIIHHEKENILNNILDKKHPKNIENVQKLPTPENGKMSKNYPLSKWEYLDIPKTEFINPYLSFEFFMFESLATEEQKEALKKQLELDKEFGRFCPVTCASLRHEKEGVRYALSNTFLWLKKNHPDYFNFLCSALLPHTGKIPVRENDKIKHLCKQVRNRYNQRIRRLSGLGLKID